MGQKIGVIINCLIDCLRFYECATWISKTSLMGVLASISIGLDLLLEYFSRKLEKHRRNRIYRWGMKKLRVRFFGRKPWAQVKRDTKINRSPSIKMQKCKMISPADAEFSFRFEMMSISIFLRKDWQFDGGRWASIPESSALQGVVR